MEAETHGKTLKKKIADILAQSPKFNLIVKTSYVPFTKWVIVFVE